jgi:hypothetical protein
MNRTSLRTGLAATALALLAAGHASAGTITRADATQPFEWTSTECRSPERPLIRKGDPNRQKLMQDYALAVEYYIDCLKREAQADYDRTQVEMQEAVQRKLQSEVDALNNSVEMMVRATR